MVLNKKSNSILVTGGAGFIGSNIVEKLLNEKNKVIVFDNFLRGKKNNFDNKNIKIIDGDIRKINDLDKIKTKIDTVIHLAYLNGTKYFYDNLKPNELYNIKPIRNKSNGGKLTQYDGPPNAMHM